MAIKVNARETELKSGLITSRRIVFTPSVDLKDELKNTSIQITCYDRDGKIVKRVTTDAGEVEDPEEDENGGGSNDNQDNNDNNGGNNQGGQNQGGGSNNNDDLGDGD